jgi:hypothetical protein
MVVDDREGNGFGCVNYITGDQTMKFLAAMSDD